MSKNIKAKDVFKVGEHNIGFVSDSFLSEFGNEPMKPGKVLSMQVLPRYMRDSEIISELKVKDCTISDVIITLDSATKEMKDGWWNIFYIAGHSHVVSVYWDDGMWNVHAWQRDDYDWDAGHRVFSPATDAKKLNTQPSDSLKLRKNKHAVALGKIGGSKKTIKKSKASRINGKKGGRPKTKLSAKK